MLSTFSHASRRTQAKIWLFLARVRLVLFLLAAVVIFCLSISKSEKLSSVRSYILNQTSIITHYITAPVRIKNSFIKWVNAYIDVHGKNQILIERLKHAEELAFKAHGLALENDQLRAALKMLPPEKVKFITVPVLGLVKAPYTKLLMLGAGSKNGIKIRQPVIEGQQIIGRIVEVSEHASRVLLMQDINSHIPVILSETKVQGIVSGDNHALLKMQFFETEAKAKIGELAFTSGQGGIFPKGYLVGRVVRQQGETLWIKSLVKLSQLDYVRVFTEINAFNEEIKPLINEKELQ